MQQSVCWADSYKRTKISYFYNLSLNDLLNTREECHDIEIDFVKSGAIARDDLPCRIYTNICYQYDVSELGVDGALVLAFQNLTSDLVEFGPKLGWWNAYYVL